MLNQENIRGYQTLIIPNNWLNSHKKHNDKKLTESIPCKQYIIEITDNPPGTMELSHQTIRGVKRNSLTLNALANFGEGLGLILVLAAFVALYSMSDIFDALLMGVR